MITIDSNTPPETIFPDLAVGDVFKWARNDDVALIKVNDWQALIVDRWGPTRTLSVSPTAPVIRLGRVAWAD